MILSVNLIYWEVYEANLCQKKIFLKKENKGVPFLAANIMDTKEAMVAMILSKFIILNIQNKIFIKIFSGIVIESNLICKKQKDSNLRPPAWKAGVQYL